MAILDWIRFVAGAVCLVLALVIYVLEVIGVFRFKYVLNRMHAAAMGDSLGLLLAMVGLILINGWQGSSLKMLLVVVFFWLTSPVASHLIAQMELKSCVDPEEKFDQLDLTEDKEERDANI